MFPTEFVRSLDAEPGPGSGVNRSPGYESEAGVGVGAGVGLAAEEVDALLEALDGEAVVSVRYNPYKLSAMPARGGFGDGWLPVGEPVPWNRYGAYLAGRPSFTLDPAWHAGAYYVQEASSQFVEYLFRSAVLDEFSSPAPLRVLDLCAAPGGKATLYSTLVGPEGLVVANEIVKNRASVLVDNVKRWGIGNVAVTCNEPAAFAAYRHFFDVVAVDAPCSGEGMFRRVPASRNEWSAAGVEMCAARQRRILADVWDALRPGGVLIYSTCTFNRRENEDNVAWLMENFDAQPVAINVPPEWSVVGSCFETPSLTPTDESPRDCLSSEHDIFCADRGFGAEDSTWRTDSVTKQGGAKYAALSRQTFRFYPHKVKGEGFFAAVLRKGDGRVRREVPRARREVLTDVVGAERRALEPWLAAPEAMRFVRAGDNCYALYRHHYQDITALAGGLNVIYSGVCMGQLFGDKLRPDHALALAVNLARGRDFRGPADTGNSGNAPLGDTGGVTNGGICADANKSANGGTGGVVANGGAGGVANRGMGGDTGSGLFHETALSREAALDYLRKREFADVGALFEGLNLLTYNNLPIGWTKRIGHRTNTLLPAGFRIVNL